MNRSRSVRVVVDVAISLALIVPIGCAGCHSHVHLSAPPPPTAAQQERIAAFERLASPGGVEVVTTQDGKEIDRSAKFIVLNTGDRVYYPEDLLPVVGADSASGRAASASASSRKAMWAFTIIGGLAAGVGLGLWYSTLDVYPDDPDWEASKSRFDVGTGFIVASAVPLLVAWYYQSRSKDERAAAFLTYNNSLRERLRLCVDGTRLVDCDTAAPAETPPAETPAAETPAAETPAETTPPEMLPPPAIPPPRPPEPASDANPDSPAADDAAADAGPRP